MAAIPKTWWYVVWSHFFVADYSQQNVTDARLMEQHFGLNWESVSLSFNQRIPTPTKWTNLSPKSISEYWKPNYRIQLNVPRIQMLNSIMWTKISEFLGQISDIKSVWYSNAIQNPYYSATNRLKPLKYWTNLMFRSPKYTKKVLIILQDLNSSIQITGNCLLFDTILGKTII